MAAQQYDLQKWPGIACKDTRRRKDVRRMTHAQEWCCEEGDVMKPSRTLISDQAKCYVACGTLGMLEQFKHQEHIHDDPYRYFGWSVARTEESRLRKDDSRLLVVVML